MVRDSDMGRRWLLSGLFTGLVVLGALLFEGELRIIAVGSAAFLYFLIRRRSAGF